MHMLCEKLVHGRVSSPGRPCFQDKYAMRPAIEVANGLPFEIHLSTYSVIAIFPSSVRSGYVLEPGIIT